MKYIRQIDNKTLKPNLIESHKYFEEIVYINQLIVKSGVTGYPLDESNEGFSEFFGTYARSPLRTMFDTYKSYYFGFVTFDLIGTNHVYRDLSFNTVAELKAFINAHFNQDGTYFTEDVYLRMYDKVSPEVEQIFKIKGINSAFSSMRGKGHYDRGTIKFIWSSAYTDWGEQFIIDLINYDRGVSLATGDPQLVWLVRRGNVGETIKLYSLIEITGLKAKNATYYDTYTQSIQSIANWNNQQGIVFDKFYVRFSMDYTAKKPVAWSFLKSFEISKPFSPYVVVYKVGNAEDYYQVTQYGYLIKPVNADFFVINAPRDDKNNYYIDIILKHKNGTNYIIKRIDCVDLAKIDNNLGFLKSYTMSLPLIAGKRRIKNYEIILAFRRKFDNLLGFTRKKIKVEMGAGVLYSFI